MQVLHDILGQLLRGGQVVQVGQGLVLDPEDIQAGLVPGKDLLRREAVPAAFRVLLISGLMALMPVLRVVTLNKVLQIPKGHGTLLEGKVHIGPQIVYPDLLGLPRW